MTNDAPEPEGEFLAAFHAIGQLASAAERIDALTSLVRRADAEEGKSMRRTVRGTLVAECLTENMLGRQAVALPAFAWLLADFDADPDAAAADGVDAETLLTWYGRIIPVAAYDPAVPRDTIEELLADHDRRNAAWGGSESSAANVAFWTAVKLGEFEALPLHFARNLKDRRRHDEEYPRDSAALIGIFSGDADLTLDALLPLVDGTAPHAWLWDGSSYRSWLLRPLVWKGLDQEADVYYGQLVAEGYRGTEDSGFVLEYAARVKDEATIRRWLPGVLRSCPNAAGDGALEIVHAALACEVLAETGDRPLVVPFPDGVPNVPPTDARGRTAPSAAAGPLWDAAASFMAALDARNGNDTYTRGLVGDRAFVFGPPEDMPRLPAERRERLRALWETHGTPPPGSRTAGGVA